MALSFIPYSCGAGASTAGCQQGPSYIYEKGLHHDISDALWVDEPSSLFKDTSFSLESQHDLKSLAMDKRADIVYKHVQYLREKIAQSIHNGDVPVVFGGDHSMAAGSIAGLADAKDAYCDVGLIWVDAHPDINTRKTSVSGAPHGMPIAALLGIGADNLLGHKSQQTILSPEHLFYIGIRDIDPPERDFIDQLGIAYAMPQDIAQSGLKDVLSHAISHVSKSTSALAVSIDLDAFDQSDMPSVGTPVPGGLSLDEFCNAWPMAMQDVQFDLIEFAEFNPTLKDVDVTYRSIKKLVTTVLSTQKTQCD